MSVAILKPTCLELFVELSLGVVIHRVMVEILVIARGLVRGGFITDNRPTN